MTHFFPKNRRVMKLSKNHTFLPRGFAMDCWLSTSQKVNWEVLRPLLWGIGNKIYSHADDDPSHDSYPRLR